MKVIDYPQTLIATDGNDMHRFEEGDLIAITCADKRSIKGRIAKIGIDRIFIDTEEDLGLTAIPKHQIESVESLNQLNLPRSRSNG